MRGEEFERLYAQYAQSLLDFLTYRTGDRVLAEDVLADTFERVLRARRRFDSRKASKKTWLYAIALNALRDHARRRGAESRALERAAAPAAVSASPDPASIDTRDEIHRALDALTPEQREVVALRYGADLTLPEIARITRTRLTTIEGRLYGALRKLRDQMSPDQP
jgi:RNA polymerase sigma-70 factor (ECF subfamily)